MKPCVFCSVVKNNRPHHEIIWESNDHIAFLDAFPLVDGHTLVIPKQHTNYVFDLDDTHYAKLFLAAKKLAPTLKRVLKAKRVAVVVEGFSVPHVHVHLVPLRRAKGLAELHSKKGDPKKLARLARALRGR